MRQYCGKCRVQTDVQAVAIEFNQNECSKVNRTAPAFVGCSPLNISSLTNAQPNPVTTLSTQTSFQNTQISTVSGTGVTEPPAFSGATTTASFAGAPLLTGTCSNPYFAVVTNSAGVGTEFPAIGCGPDRPECCPFPFGSNARLSRCPQDYFTTSAGCCPL